MRTETTSPYPGPQPFTAEDRERFFGRSRELQDLVALVIAQPLTVLYGATGAGKTSPLCAGVVPELERTGFEVMPVARVGGLLPPDVDATRLRNVFTYSVLLHWAGPEDDLGALAQHTLASFLAPRLKKGGRRPLAIVLDQLGDMFSAYPTQWEQREAFLRAGSLLRLGKTVLQFELGMEINRIPLSEATHFGTLTGVSAAMRAAFTMLACAAESDATVLLEGETGKRLSHRAIRLACGLRTRSRASRSSPGASTCATSISASRTSRSTGSWTPPAC